MREAVEAALLQTVDFPFHLMASFVHQGAVRIVPVVPGPEADPAGIVDTVFDIVPDIAFDIRFYAGLGTVFDIQLCIVPRVNHKAAFLHFPVTT